MKKLNHKLALITGASSGIGHALAMKLAEKGVNLLLTGRNQSKLSTLASYLRPHVDVTFFPCDLANAADRKRLLFHIHELAPDLIINNAGCGLFGPVLSYSTEEMLSMFEVNAVAALEITMEGARMLLEKKKKGVILNVSSFAAYFTSPYLAIYSASKNAVLQFSKSFDAEIKQHHIRILASCPGQTDTPFFGRASSGHFHPKSSFTMTKEYAAERIIKQIEKKKSVDIFDIRYKLGMIITRFFPDKILLPFFKRAMQKRFPKASL